MNPNGEKNLWHAVIEVAVKDAVGRGVGLTEIQKKIALNWFIDNRRDTFQYVCSLAGLNPHAVRDRFLQYRESILNRDNKR